MQSNFACSERVDMRVKSSFRILGILGVLSSLAVVAFAQTTPPPPALDYAAMMTSGKNELVSSLGSYAPILFGLMAIMVGLGVGWRWIKKAMKSS